MAQHKSMQKMRSEGQRERARASGGGLRSTPAEGKPGPGASTGGSTSRGMLRSSSNSRSSSSGRKGSR